MMLMGGWERIGSIEDDIARARVGEQNLGS